MKIQIAYCLLFFIGIGITAVYSQQIKSDFRKDLAFNGDHLVYKGKKITLGPNAFFIDGQLSTTETAKYKYVFNSVNEAAKHLTDGTERSPMVLYIAPYVYWIDDPDDPAVRVSPITGGTPFGLEIKCEWLKFFGLSDDARNVILASNRGQTIGAKGNAGWYVSNTTTTVSPDDALSGVDHVEYDQNKIDGRKNHYIETS